MNASQFWKEGENGKSKDPQDKFSRAPTIDGIVYNDTCGLGGGMPGEIVEPMW